MEARNAGDTGASTTIYRGSRVSDVVTATVAETRGVDPLELEPLYDVVDPDALDAVVAATGGSDASSVEVRFTMAGCDVVVHGDGVVDVTPPSDEAPSHGSTGADE